MVTKAQAGAGVAVTAAVGTSTGVGVTLKNKWDEFQFPPMPGFTVLSLETDFGSEYPIGSDKDNRTTGWLLGGYLTGTYGVEKTDQGKTDNEDWWEWSYERWKKDVSRSKNLSEEFNDKNVFSAFSSKGSSEDGSSTNALNEVCKKIYKKKLRDFNFKSPTDVQQNNLIKDLLRYCSPLGQRPKTIEDKREREKVGNSWKNDYHYLISVDDKSNDLFWELRNNDFFSESNSNFWSGSSLNNTKNPLFYELYSKKNDNPRKIKEICKESYGWESRNNSTDDGYDVAKFCSWSYSIYLYSDV